MVYESDNIQELSALVVGKKFGIRAAAYLIDVVLIAILNYLIIFFVSFIIGVFFLIIQKQIPLESQISNTLDFLVSLSLTFSYFVIFEWLYGASLGKLILRMRVTMQDGEPCTFKAALIRGIYRLVDGLIFGLPAYFRMKFPFYQRIGDNAAHTIVISSKDAYLKQPHEWWWLLIAGFIYLMLRSLVTFFLMLFAWW